MKIFPTSAIKQIDAYTIEHEPIASIDLMERAAVALTEAIATRWDDPSTPIVIFAGPGNNGGDALAVARLLADRGYRTQAYLFNIKDKLSPDCQVNRDRLVQTAGAELHEVTTRFAPPRLTKDHVVVDGLFGSGLNKPLTGGLASVVKYLNASAATVVAIDVPSGLMGEDNANNIGAHIVRPDLTLTLQQPKLAFFLPENAAYVGEWEALDIGLHPDAIEQTATSYSLTEPDEVAALVKPRARFAHKGDFGRALLIAGQQGMAGASVLTARACLKSGVGLLTVHLPFCNNFIVQTAVPEAMTQLDSDDTCFSEAVDTDPFQTVGIGPGLGQSDLTREAVYEQIETCQAPMVIDADALNLLAERRDVLGHLPAGSILTPHVGEMERLVGHCKSGYERLQRGRELAMSAGCHIVLKGAYTAIISPAGTIRFNPTGNPGMATAGSGDALTGVLLALLAQGYDAGTAATLGVFAHGLAGDVAASRQGVIGMTASDIVSALPMVWRKLMEG